MFATIFLLTFSFFSCSSDEDPVGPDDAAIHGVLVNYANIVHANYEDCLLLTRELKTACQALVNTPSEATLSEARAKWLQARDFYGQTEAFRFYDGPIDDADGPEGLLNAWPLDEAYIDYVDGNDNSGIINNPAIYPEITSQVLTDANERGGETNIATGFHAIEFLLWGQDLNTPGPGNRPYTDFMPGGTAAHQDRRSTYLLVCVTLLETHLETLVNAWQPTGTNYRSQFLAAPVLESLKKVTEGIGKLTFGELRGERIIAALDSREQEDEHSCFSDNTHKDVIANIQGVHNVCMGTYTRSNGTTVQGSGILSLLLENNNTLKSQLTTQLESTLQLAKSIQPPFDMELTNPSGRDRLTKVVDALEKQGSLLSQYATAMGFQINTSLD